MLNHKLSINFLPLIYTIYWKCTQKTFKKICGVWCRQSGTDCKRELMALCTNGTFIKAVMITYDLLGSNTVCFMFTSWALSLPIPASTLQPSVSMDCLFPSDCANPHFFQHNWSCHSCLESHPVYLSKESSCTCNPHSVIMITASLLPWLAPQIDICVYIQAYVYIQFVLI